MRIMRKLNAVKDWNQPLLHRTRVFYGVLDPVRKNFEGIDGNDDRLLSKKSSDKLLYFNGFLHNLDPQNTISILSGGHDGAG